MPFSFPASPTVGQQSTQNGRLYQWTGSAWELASVPDTIASTNISDATAAGRAILTAADAAAQRTSLGLGTMATETAANYLARTGGTMTGQLVIPTGSAAAPAIGVTGDLNCGLAQLGGIDTLGIVTAGVERVRVGADGAQSSVVPGASTLLPQFACRAWVMFDGTRDTNGSVSTANTARQILGSGNVASVTRNAAGDFTIAFITAMPDANYCVAGSLLANPGVAVGSMNIPSALAASVRVTSQNTTNNALYDCSRFSVAVFR